MYLYTYTPVCTYICNDIYTYVYIIKEKEAMNLRWSRDIREKNIWGKWRGEMGVIMLIKTKNTFKPGFRGVQLPSQFWRGETRFVDQLTLPNWWAPGLEEILPGNKVDNSWVTTPRVSSGLLHVHVQTSMHTHLNRYTKRDKNPP